MEFIYPQLTNFLVHTQCRFTHKTQSLIFFSFFPLQLVSLLATEQQVNEEVNKTKYKIQIRFIPGLQFMNFLNFSSFKFPVSMYN